MQLAQLMDGSLCVDSNVGRGSTFYFTARFGRLRAGPLTKPATRTDVLDGVRVLVVSHNATNGRLIDRHLRSWAMATTLVERVDAAVDTLQGARSAGRPFRLVIADTHAPDGNNSSSLLKQRIGEILKLEVDLLLMVSRAQQMDGVTQRKCARAPAVLLKPVMSCELLEAMTGVLQRSLEEQSAAHPVLEEERTESGQWNILLVEDSLVNQKLAAGILRKRGHYVVTADNGREALEILETRNVDVILMDIQMPEMDGIEATREIRSKERETNTHIPIIAVTAHALPGDRERCQEVGMDDYVTKPIEAQQLLPAIETAMEN